MSRAVLLAVLSTGVLGFSTLAQDRSPQLQTDTFGDAIRFRHVSSMDTPIKLFVEAIYQDELGFMWFGTEDGLFRHDGIAARTYRPVPFDSTSISDPWINGFASAGSNGFWVSTQSGGLNRYDPMEETFTAYPAAAPIRLRGLVMDADSILWIASNFEGLVRFDPRTGTSTKLRSKSDDPSSLPSDRISAVLTDNSGFLWVGTYDAGLCRYDKTEGSCTTYRFDAGNNHSLPANRITSLVEDGSGQIWVGTFGGGIARFDAQSDSFIRYPNAGAARASRNVYSMLADPGGNIWIGSEAGLDRIDPVTGNRRSYRHSGEDPSTIGRGNVMSLFLDRTGIIWIGTESGVSYFNSAPSAFRHYIHNPEEPNSLSGPEVWAIYEDSDGIVWVGTDIGLNRIDRTTGTVTRFLADPSDPSRLASNLVMGITETTDGVFWVSSRRGGLQEFDRKTGRVVKRFTEIPGDKTSLYSDNPWFILEDSRGRRWITSGGQGCLNEMTASGSFVRHCHDPEDPNTPAHNFARYMIESRDGTLWLGTWGGGLDRIDPETLEFTHYRHNRKDRNTPASNFILSIYEDSDGIIWLGTYGAGLSRLDPATGSFTHYSSHDSDLSNDTIYGIQPDDNGCLWLSTNAGLVRFDPERVMFRTFGVSDGIQDPEFNSGASFRSATGELFFGGVNGVNAFYPDDVRDHDSPPTIILTGLQAGGRWVDRPGEDSPVAVALPYAREITLRPQERDVSIRFAALHFIDPERILYRYRLDGYDKEWHRASGDRTATYTNLNPGTYAFEVQAADGNGAWSNAPLTVPVVAVPFFYETALAKIAYALLFVGLLFFAYRRRHRRLVLQHDLEIEHIESQKLRELDKTRTIFFANISHEFRTPLTLALGPVDDVLAGVHGTVTTAARDQLILARRNAARVLDLINQILDVARLESGRTRLRARQMDLSRFVDEIALVFVPLAERSALSFEVQRAADKVEVWADPQQIEKVLYNLLSNAFKFTQTGGVIRVMVGCEGDKAVISVRDNGQGIPASEVPYIFDRFHQADVSSTRMQPGTGIGLALAREIIDLHHGEIIVTSDEGFGSTFTVRLPLGKSHLSEDQIDESPEGHVLTPPHASAPPTALEEQLADSVFEDCGDSNESDDRTTVLVIDDHPELRAYIRRHLEVDYRVIEAEDGLRALELIRSQLPDLVLSDVMMPNMDGFEFCRSLKSDPEMDFIPVVLLTARANHEDKINALKQAADAYLTKPFDPNELRCVIENLISGRRLLKERFAGIEPAAESLNGSENNTVKSSDQLFLDRVRQVVGERFSDESFSVEQLAEAIGVSRTHLFRMVRRLTGQSPSDVIREMRLHRAAFLLENHVGNVSEIAYATGFKSLASFSRSFSEKFGCRPSAFREKVR